MANAVTNSSLRSFIKTHALEEVNGDTEFLYDRVKNLKVEGDRSFLDLLLESWNDLQVEEDLSPEYFFGAYAHQVDPLLTIRVPSLNEVTAYEWDVNKHVPAVTFMTHEHDEETHSQVLVFTSDGSSSLITVDPEPLEMTLVLKENERIVAYDPQEMSDFYGLSWKVEGFDPISSGIRYQYFHYVELLNQQKLAEPTNNTQDDQINSRSCYRDSRNNRDLMYSFKWANCDSWKKNCDWLDGRCELDATCIVVTTPSNPSLSSLKKGFDDRRRDFITTGKNKCRNSHQPKWYIIQNELGFKLEYYNWKLDQYGDIQKYHWFERDGGPKVELGVEIPSGKFNVAGVQIPFPKLTGKITFDAKDDDLHEDLVYYCDSYGTQNATGRIQFTVFEQ